MKIVLIRPNSYILPTAPPMGLAAVAAWLRLKRADDVAILDARKERLSMAQLAEIVAALSPDVVGIGALSAEAGSAHDAAKVIKLKLPEVKTIMGGPHATVFAERVLADQNVDYVVVGEAEESLRELLDVLESGAVSRPIAGVWGRYEGEVLFGGARDSLDVDSLPAPAWDLLPMETYFRSGRNTHDTIPPSVRCLQVMTSRGCPFRCIYCHGLFGRVFRPKSAENVLAEVENLVDRYKLKAIEICDDIFNLDLDRAKAILRGLAQLHIAVSFPNGIRADRIDEELLDVMETAGVRRVSLALESVNPRIQNIIRKGLNLEKAKKAIAAASKRRFVSTGYFILGSPGETAEEMEETIRFACESDLHLASFFYLTPFAGTEAARIAKEKGINVNESPFDYSTLYVNLSAVSDKLLRDMRKKAYRKFYLNPRRIWRTFSSAPKSSRTFINAWKVLLLSLKDSVNY